MRNKKNDAWKAISEDLDIDKVDVMKKVDTLIGQFRREIKKMVCKSGSGSEEIYKGNWFAFNSLIFLLDKMKPRSTIPHKIFLVSHKMSHDRFQHLLLFQLG